MKRQWRNIARSDYNDDDEVFSDLDVRHTSMYLDLFVLSQDVELKMKSICLTSEWPFIMEPNSSFRVSWDYISLLSILMQSTILPFCICFLHKIPWTAIQIGAALDLIYLIDFTFVMTTAVKQRHVFITSWSAILSYSSKNFWFLVDIVSVIYIDYPVMLFSDNWKMLAWMRINRLFKIYKIYAFFNHLQVKLKYNTLYVRIVKYGFHYSISVYWIMCISYAVACPTTECNENGWLKRSQYLFKERKLTKPRAFQDVLDTLFLTGSVYLNFGASPYSFFTISEIGIFQLICILGYAVQETLFAELSSAYMLFGIDRALHYFKDNALRNTQLYKKNLTPYLQKQFITFSHFQWESTGSVSRTTANDIFQEASDDIIQQIIEERKVKTLKLVPLFHNMDHLVIRRIAHISVSHYPVSWAIEYFEPQ